jgi:hypothetical protein
VAKKNQAMIVDVGGGILHAIGTTIYIEARIIGSMGI